MITPYLSAPEGKVDEISQILWTSWESILVAIDCRFELPHEEETETVNGYFIFTIGAMYFFEKKAIGRPEYRGKYSILDCRVFHLKPSGSFELEFDEFWINIDTNNGKEVAKVMVAYLDEIFYDIPGFNRMSVIPPIDGRESTIKSRPNNALKNRALLLAHFYDYYQPFTGCFGYFDKWEEEKDPMILIGSHFHSEKFSTAIGHAIAWDPCIDTINFQNFAAPEITRILSAVLENSIFIDRVVFSYYKKEKLPEIEIKHVHSNKVKKFWFVKCCSSMILDFFKNTIKDLPSPIPEINISKTQFKTSEFSELLSSISRSTPSRQAKKLRFSSLTCSKYPFDDLQRLVKNMDKLQSVCFTNLEGDATDFLSCVCAAQTSLKSLIIERMTFTQKIDIKSTRTPPLLLLLSINFCAFNPSSFKSLINFVTCRPVQIPFILQAQALDITPASYQKLAEVDWTKCYPNLSEIDWSGNSIPKVSSLNFFDFLFTQKYLRHLILYNIHLKNTSEFWANLLRLVTALRLPGLTIGGKFPGSIFMNLINGLKDTPFIRRLQLRCPATHDEGLTAFQESITHMPEISEVLADGFRPTNKEVFFNFWRMISTIPTIHSCDYPTYDMKVLRLKKKNLPPDMKEVFKIIESKSRPSTVRQRVEYMTAIVEERLGTGQTNNHEQYNNIFTETAAMECDDDDDDAQEKRMKKKKKNKNKK